MTLSDKQLNKIARYIHAQDDLPLIEEDGASWRDDTEGELLLYADNTSEIYPMKQQIIKIMKKKIENGVYDPEAAVKGWMYWVDAAAKSYVKEFASGPYHEIFPKDVRMNVAKEVAEREYESIVNGEYDERSARKVGQASKVYEFEANIVGTPKGEGAKDFSIEIEASSDEEAMDKGYSLFKDFLRQQSWIPMVYKENGWDINEGIDVDVILVDSNSNSVVDAERFVFSEDQILW